MDKRWLGVAGIVGCLGVALGAFGAHALQGLPPLRIDNYRTAAQYHLVHALALLATAALPVAGRWVRVARWSFLVGILVFSGSLYLLAVTGDRRLGAVTPFGGVALLAGWAAVAVAGLRRETPPA